MRDAFFNTKWFKSQENTGLSADYWKIQFRTKKVCLKLQLMRNVFLKKKWLNFSKRQFLTQNGVTPGKTLVSTQILKNPVLIKKGVSQPTVDTKPIFKQEMVKF